MLTMLEFCIDHIILVKIYNMDKNLLLQLWEYLCRITRPWWHSLNINFGLVDFPFKDCGSTVRYGLVLTVV